MTYIHMIRVRYEDGVCVGRNCFGHEVSHGISGLQEITRTKDPSDATSGSITDSTDSTE